MSIARRCRSTRLLFVAAFAALAFGVNAAAAAAVPTLSINDVTMNEGNSGTTGFTFRVTLSDPPPGNFTIMANFATANGTATAGACVGGGDYVSKPGQLTFNRNNLFRDVTIDVCGDTALELDETFVVNLSNPTGGAVILDGQGLGTIRNDDLAPVRPTSTSVSCQALTVGVAATCTATVTDTGAGTKTTPTGTVAWSSTAGDAFVPDPCVLAPTATVGVASCTVEYVPNSAGSVTVTATYGGDATHSGSQGQTTVTVAKRPTSTTVSCGALTVGIAASCTATVTDTGSGMATTPTGTVEWSSTAGGTFVPDPCVISPTATVGVASCTVEYTPTSAGTATITATYGGDLTHAGSEGRTSVTVAKRPTQTSVACQDGTFEAGGSTSCTATVTDTGGGTKFTPTGTADWSSTETGTFLPDPCALAPTATLGVASCTVAFSSTKAATHTISATYGGDPIHTGSAGTTTVTVTPGPPATVTLDPPTAENPVDTEHCVTAIVKDRFGNPTPGIDVVFAVTGSNRAGGTDDTNAEGEAEFCYIGRLFGLDAIDAFADTDADGGRDPGEPAGAAAKLWRVPASTPLCAVEFPTLGGHITASNGDRGSFGGNAHVSATGLPSGALQYRDHGPAQPLTVHSVEVVAVVCVRFPDGHAEATIFGEATVDGSGRFPFRVDVEDRGEPGSADTYWITIANGYDSGRQTLEGGNVTIH